MCKLCVERRYIFNGLTCQKSKQQLDDLSLLKSYTPIILKSSLMSLNGEMLSI